MEITAFFLSAGIDFSHINHYNITVVNQSGCSAVGDVPEALPVADKARAKEWRNKEYHEISSETTMLQQEARLQQLNSIVIGV